MKYVFCVITKLHISQIFHVKIYTGTQLPFLGAFDHLQSVSQSVCPDAYKNTSTTTGIILQFHVGEFYK